MSTQSSRSLLFAAMILIGGLDISLAEEFETTLCIRNVTVVDVIEGKIRRNQEIFIRGRFIERIGPQPLPHSPATTVIDGSRLVALPGFINTHTHLWQHVAKSVAPDQALQEWTKAVYPIAHYLTRQDVRQITHAAAAQASLSGITTVVDFASCNFSEYSLDATIDGLEDAGLDAAIIWWTPAAFLPPAAQEREIARLAALDKTRFRIWIGPSPLSFFDVPVTYHGIMLAKRTGSRLAEHTMENIQEQRDLVTKISAYLAKYGKLLPAKDAQVLKCAVGRVPLSKSDSMQELRRHAERLIQGDANRSTSHDGRLLSRAERRELRRLVEDGAPSPVPILELFQALPGFLAIHSVWPSDADVAAFAKYNVSVSLNPESNMYLASGAPPLAAYCSRGINFTLGTDGAASNDGIDFFSAMRATWNLGKVDMLDPEAMKSVNAWEILRAATINGAVAVGLEEVTGSLDPGKDADLVLLSLDRFGLAPFRESDTQNASLIVNSAGIRDITYVISNGRVIVKDQQLAEQDEPELAQRLSEIWAEARQNRTEGKTWNEEISLTAESSTLLRYRSVRPRDRVDILLKNQLDHDVEAFVAKSGQPFGGACAAMLSPDVLARTPLDRIEQARKDESDAGAYYKEWRVKLTPGQSLHFRKSNAEMIYRLSTPAGEIEEKAAKAEQLLFLVEQ